MPELMFRDATTDDAAALERLINGAYRPAGPSPGWTNETSIIEGARTDGRTIAAEIGKGDRYLVCQEDGVGPVLACVSIAKVDGAALYLSSIAVDATRQDRGIGRELLGEVERQARAAGIATLRMSVIAIRKELIAWYERRGFARTGEIMDFPYDDEGVGRPLRDDLSLVALEKALS